MNRRTFILGSSAILAASSIVRASSLMPVSVPKSLFIGIDLASGPDMMAYGFSPAMDALKIYRAYRWAMMKAWLQQNGQLIAGPLPSEVLIISAMTMRAGERQDILSRIRATAKNARKMKHLEPHLAGMWEAISNTLDAADTEISRLRDITGEPRPGRGLSHSRTPFTPAT